MKNLTLGLLAILTVGFAQAAKAEGNRDYARGYQAAMTNVIPVIAFASGQQYALRDLRQNCEEVNTGRLLKVSCQAVQFSRRHVCYAICEL